jgi:hypothetical protein
MTERIPTASEITVPVRRDPNATVRPPGTKPGFDPAVVAIAVDDDCGWSSQGDVCVSATFLCPHTSHTLDYWTFDSPAVRRDNVQRAVQDLATDKSGCQCGLEPTDLDVGILSPNGRIDGTVTDRGSRDRPLLTFVERTGRRGTFEWTTGRLFFGEVADD